MILYISYIVYGTSFNIDENTNENKGMKIDRLFGYD